MDLKKQQASDVFSITINVSCLLKLKSLLRRKGTIKDITMFFKREIIRQGFVDKLIVR